MSDYCEPCAHVGSMMVPSVASATNPLTGEPVRVCAKHAEVFDQLDDESRKGYVRTVRVSLHGTRTMFGNVHSPDADELALIRATRLELHCRRRAEEDYQVAPGWLWFADRLRELLQGEEPKLNG